MSVIIARIAQRRLYPIVAGVDIPAISVSVIGAIVPGRKRRLCMADTARSIAGSVSKR